MSTMSCVVRIETKTPSTSKPIENVTSRTGSRRYSPLYPGHLRMDRQSNGMGGRDQMSSSFDLSAQHMQERKQESPSHSTSFPPSMSHPVVATSIAEPSKASRRAIFGNYWERGETDSQSSSQEGDLRARSRSLSLTDDPAGDVDIRYFSPPLDRQGGLKKHHSLVDEGPEDVRLLALPPPLRRYVSDGPTGGGVYPLRLPCSILRKRSSDDESPTAQGNSERPGDFNHEEDKDIVKQVKNMKWAEMTTAVKPGPSILSKLERVDLDDAMTKTSELFRRSGLSTTEEEPIRNVQFDPRIVITEFDDEAERKWFTEGELNTFKAETIYLAQEYMMTHPELAEEFTRSEIDPITGRERRRALFSLPFLSAQPDDAVHCSNSPRASMEKIARAEIKRILIVDPNKMILELLCKSMKQLFPHAKLAVAQTGEAALRIYESAAGQPDAGFDVVVTEEKLYRISSMGPDTRSGRNLNPEEGSNLFFSTDSIVAERRGGKQASLSDIQSISRPLTEPSRRRGISGSGLLRSIRLLERQGLEPGKPVVPKSASLRTTVGRRVPLLIGVSVNAARDKKTLQESGADMIWGKPPPRMDETLRIHMLSVLLEKRQARSTFCMRPAGEQDQTLDVSY